MFGRRLDVPGIAISPSTRLLQHDCFAAVMASPTIDNAEVTTGLRMNLCRARLRILEVPKLSGTELKVQFDHHFIPQIQLRTAN